MDEGQAPAWRFAPGQLGLAPGGTLLATNRGGEDHTFTEVAAFGGGCVAVLNGILGLSPVPECSVPGLFDSTLVEEGRTLEVNGLAPGAHRFECLIHPWMRTTVTVARRFDGGRPRPTERGLLHSRLTGSGITRAGRSPSG
jgi:plastocyanin